MKKDDTASRTTQAGFSNPPQPLNRPSFNCATPMKPIQEETSSITTPECFDSRSHRSSFGDRCKSGTETPGRSGLIASVSGESDSNATSTPPYVKWANGFDSLLEDPEGQKVFQSYLRSEDALNNLMFWYAVNGFKTQVDKRKKYRLATVIGRTFLKKNSPNALTEISSENRKLILDSIRKDNIDGSTFDRAQLEIENFLKEKAYFMFLKSDVYIEYCNKIIQQQEQLLRNSDSKQGLTEVPTISSSQTLEGNSSVSSSHGTSGHPPGSTAVPANASGTFSSKAPETQLPATDSVDEVGEDVNTCTNSESVSSTNRDTTSVPSTKHSNSQAGSTTSQGNASLSEAVGTGLATVHEDTELLCKEINLRGGNKGFEATSDTFAASSPTCRKSSADALNCSGCSYASTSGINERKSHKGSHMYTNFAPVGSTNDSEIQSLSSDTHTDDSLSINDSVLDTSHLSSMGKRLQQHVVKRDRKYIKYSAQQNGSHARMFPHAQLTRSSHISTTNNVNRSQCEQNLSVPEFAALLIQKLEIAKSEKERSERVAAQHEYRSNYHATVDSIDLNSTSASSSDGLSLSKPCRMPSSNVIMQSAGGGISYITSKSSNQNSASGGGGGGGGNSSADQEDPESIIDNHVSRVFRDSTHSPVNARSKTPDKYSTMLAHQKCSSCGQNTFSQTLPPNYRNNQILQPGMGVPGSGVGFGPGAMGSKHSKQLMPPSVAYENMHLAMQQGGSHVYSKSMRSSTTGPHSAHRKIMAESSSSKSTSSGVDSGVYDAQSLGSSDSYGGKHAMVTQWVETHRQQSSSHQSHLTKPEFNLSAVSHSSDPNMPTHGLNAAMPGVQLVPSGGGSRRTMGGASTSRTGGSSTTGRHRWASVSPGPLNSRFSTLPSATNNAIACNPQLTIYNAPSAMSGSTGGGLSVGSSNQLAGSSTPSSQTTQVQSQAQSQQPSLPPQAHQLSGSSSSSHRRSPVSSGLPPAVTAAAGSGAPSATISSSQNNNSSMGSLAAANTSASSAPGGPSSSACCNSSSQIQPNSSSSNQQTVVAYYFCNETIPYRTTVPYKNVTLGQFKALLTRRGRFRYFFKMRSNEIELGGVVQQEITEDDDELPLFDGKIIGKIEKQ